MVKVGNRFGDNGRGLGIGTRVKVIKEPEHAGEVDPLGKKLGGKVRIKVGRFQRYNTSVR
jgi:hypothetical protein